METSYQTPDDFIQTAVKLKPRLQMTLNFAEQKFHICRTHVLKSKLQVFIDLKLCWIKYFTVPKSFVSMVKLATIYKKSNYI